MICDDIGIYFRPTPAIANRIYRTADPTVISDAGAERLRREASVAALIDLRTLSDVSRYGRH